MSLPSSRTACSSDSAAPCKFALPSFARPSAAWCFATVGASFVARESASAAGSNFCSASRLAPSAA